ncbi:nucleotidyltransferase domain-containing protein [Patescibacteria group bacterium]|nr:nucleotidyltransferase domain-containing protein [Patescibacteria group bacterium]
MFNFSKIQKKVLAYFFTNPQKEHYLRELANILSIDPGNLSKNMKELTKQSFFNTKKVGTSKMFILNNKHPLYHDLKKIIFKTEGIEGSLKKIISQFLTVKKAFIFGSYAHGNEAQFSDVDVMIIGQVEEDKLVSEVRILEKKLGREINYILMTQQEFDQKRKKKNPFLENVLGDKKISLI